MMSDLRKAAQQALEALDCIYSPLHVREIDKVGAAMSALRAALAEPVANQQLTTEPVASLMTNIQSGDQKVVWNDDGFDRAFWHETPLYTAPTPRKPLTEPELHAITPTWPAPGQEWGYEEVLAFARAIERARGIGGGE